LNSTNTFLITYATLVFLSTSILSLFGVDLIGVYLLSYAVEFYVATEITPPLDLSAYRRNIVFAILFVAIFIAVVLQTAIPILQQAATG
jgi:hypothetical protein